MVMHFSIVSKIMIFIGALVQFVLLTTFLLLVYKEKIITKCADFFLRLFKKLHLVKNIKERQEKLKHVEKQYKECAQAISSHKKLHFRGIYLQLITKIVTDWCFYLCVYWNWWNKGGRCFCSSGICCNWF